MEWTRWTSRCPTYVKIIWNILWFVYLAVSCLTEINICTKTYSDFSMKPLNKTIIVVLIYYHLTNIL